MKKHYLNYLLLITIGLLLIILTRNATSYFGSTTDWLNQHVTFADYFRNMFYETGNFFSSFSHHLGGGINLFSLSYYGLYSPWLSLAFLLPMIEMITYIQIYNIASYLITILLTYKFFTYKKYPNHIALFVSLMLACATPILFHFHRQFMFVNYLPFLLLGLFGVDLLVSKGKKWLFIISTFLMVMTSFYYSISGICALFLYGVYLFIKSNKDKKGLFKSLLIPFGIGTCITVLLSSFLWLPTLFTLLGGRGSETTILSILTTLLPNVSFINLLYHNYTLGLTSISLLALVVGYFSKKKEVKILSICLIIIVLFPIVSYLFNGGLYARGKILIPFIPLVLLIVAEFFLALKHNIPWKKVIPIVCVFLLIGFFFEFRTKEYWFICVLDFIFLLSAIWLFIKKKKPMFFYIGSVLIMIPLCFFVNRFEEKYVSIYKDNNYQEKERTDLINKVLEEDKSFYRFNNMTNVTETMNKVYNSNYFQTSIYSSSLNPYYQNFYKTFLQSYSENNYLMLANTLNPLFLSYMNVKYLVSENAPLGYELVESKSDASLYKNSRTYPFAYGTSSLLSEKDFYSLSSVDKMVQLLQSAIVSAPVEGEKYHLEESKITANVKKNDLNISNKENLISFSVNYEELVGIELNHPIDNDILLLSFDVAIDSECKEGGRTITINGVSNQQSCEQWTYANKNHTFYYSLSQNTPWSQLSILISRGDYEISNIKTYLIDSNILNNYYNNISPFIVNTSLTKDNKIIGDIIQKEDGYFVTTLPFDKGFDVLVNGEPIAYELVNTSFVGFPLKKGNYYIEFIYSAPGQYLGIYISILGMITFTSVLIYDYKKYRAL